MCVQKHDVSYQDSGMDNIIIGKVKAPAFRRVHELNESCIKAKKFEGL